MTTRKKWPAWAGRAADAVRIAGLQHDIRSAATRNAQLAGDAAAYRDLADQHRDSQVSLQKARKWLANLAAWSKARRPE